MCARSNKKRLKGDEGMREIKFRAWDKYTEEMWNVETLHIEDEYVDLFKTNIYEKPLENPWAKISDVILMQYTGLKDKNGVEIYEGDIVSMVVVEDKAEYSGDVVFESGCFCLNISLDGTEYKVTALEWKETKTIITVIGNIYQNSDLLEVE